VFGPSKDIAYQSINQLKVLLETYPMLQISRTYCESPIIRIKQETKRSSD